MRENSYLAGKAVKQLRHRDVLGIAKCLGAILLSRVIFRRSI